jgi:DNA modification methylase
MLEKYTHAPTVETSLCDFMPQVAGIPQRSATIAYPFDTTKKILELIEKYKVDKKPQEVSFRELVSWMKMGERATHYIHPYPAKLLPQIAHFFLASNILAAHDDSVLDPFSGTGTVALEANLSGRNAFFADANPLARIITSVKTGKFSIKEINLAAQNLRKAYARTRKTTPPKVINIDLWYDEKICRQLSRLRWAIDSIQESTVKDLLWVTFSCVARKLSNADPRLSVPVRVKVPKWDENLPPDVWTIFSNQLQANILRLAEAVRLSSGSSVTSECVGQDARSLRVPSLWNNEETTQLADESVGLVITSPPYAGAQKYIRASSLSLGWLKLAEAHQLKQLENKNIGREHFPKTVCGAIQSTGISAVDEVLALVYKKNPLRAAIAGVYINEMRLAVIEMARVLKPGGCIVMIIGNNDVCGYNFQSSEYMSSLLASAGLKPVIKLVDEIKSRGLMTKRNRAASVISREWVLVFKK